MSTFGSDTTLAATQAVPVVKGHTLINQLKHAPNTKFSVNGTHYHIDDRGVVEGVKDEDAAVLMKVPGVWVKHDPSKSLDSIVPRKSVVALLDDKGDHYQVNNATDRPNVTLTPLASDDGKVVFVAPVHVAQGQVIHSDNPKHNPSLHLHPKVADAEQNSAQSYRMQALGKDATFDKKAATKPTASGELGEPTLESLAASDTSDSDGSKSRKRR